MKRRVRAVIHNPFDWTCNCDPNCWCATTRWGRAVMWYVPPRFHRFPPRDDGGDAARDVADSPVGEGDD
jgi:hypothetical protein